jgi:hypothetical protein
MPAAFSGIVNGQLRVTDTNAVDTVTLDHCGSTTLVNEAAYPDSAITSGVPLHVAESTSRAAVNRTSSGTGETQL